MKRIMKVATVLTIFSLLLLAACNKKDDESPKKSDGPKKEMFAFPLTGLLTDDEEAVQVRPVAAVINNDPKARPQSGLNEADIIYELLTEGGITRYLAIFQSEKPNVVGPVRSARPYFIELANGYDAFFVAHGYSPEAKAMLNSGVIDHINGIQYDGTLFQRASFRKAPHNSYISYENIKKGAEMNQYSLDQTVSPLTFMSKDEVKNLQGDEPAYKITVKYHNRYSVTYYYDESEKHYTRFTNEEQTVDYETNEPLTLENILIVEANHRIADEAGRRVIDITSGGDAILLQNGWARYVKWTNKNGRIVPVTSDGEVGLVPGKTWIHFVPADPGLKNAVSLSTIE